VVNFINPNNIHLITSGLFPLVFFQKNASFRIVIDFKEPTEKMVDHLTNLFDSQTSTDVKFVVQGREIGAHLCVLSINPVMAAMFDPDKFQEGQTKRVTIEDASRKRFEFCSAICTPVKHLD
jgi:hypothetical protein